MINNSRTQPSSIQLPQAAERFTLSGRPLDSDVVMLNEHSLTLGANDSLPALSGLAIAAGRVTFAPSTITFLTIPSAGNSACR